MGMSLLQYFNYSLELARLITTLLVASKLDLVLLFELSVAVQGVVSI